MSTITLHDGWAIFTFSDEKPALAGRLRYERIGTIEQWSLEVPAAGHKGYTAIISPKFIARVTPCSEEETIMFMHARKLAGPLPDADPTYPSAAAQ